VTLEEVALLRSRARHGEEKKGRYKVGAALVYLCGRCPEGVLDMTWPDGSGTRHAPRVWNVADDDAATALEAVAAGSLSWGVLFWVPLMAGADQPAAIARWKELVTNVEDRRRRGELAGIALIFAELVGRRRVWNRELEGFEMVESQVVKEWISQGEARGELKRQRRNLLDLVRQKFPTVSPEVVKGINDQESMPVLEDWFHAAVGATTLDEFLAVLKK
jgi:hypothetical protein